MEQRTAPNSTAPNSTALHYSAFRKWKPPGPTLHCTALHYSPTRRDETGRDEMKRDSGTNIRVAAGRDATRHDVFYRTVSNGESNPSPGRRSVRCVRVRTYTSIRWAFPPVDIHTTNARSTFERLATKTADRPTDIHSGHRSVCPHLRYYEGPPHHTRRMRNPHTHRHTQTHIHTHKHTHIHTVRPNSRFPSLHHRWFRARRR